MSFKDVIQIVIYAIESLFVQQLYNLVSYVKLEGVTTTFDYK